MIVDRKPHVLKANKSCAYPRNMIFFDVESRLIDSLDKRYHIPYLVVACHYYISYKKKPTATEKWKVFEDVESFWEWVDRCVNKKECCYMFAHNITYDLVASRGLSVLKDLGYRITRYYENNRTFILDFRKKNKTIRLMNVGNWFSGSVASIGESLGIPKLSIDYNNASIEESIEYCKRDVEIIKQAMLAWFKFCKDNDLGNFGTTAPKQSFNAFCHRFMHHKIYIHNNAKAIEIERNSYFGGRCECFWYGCVPCDVVYTLDVNSMYPYVMRDFLYPAKLLTLRFDVAPEVLREFLKNYLVCAEVLVETDIPCLPVRENNRLIFPVGRFVTSLSTPEINLAFQFGRIEKVFKVAFYEPQPLFKDFVEFFYTKRLEAKQEGNKINNMLFKLILNSLYGKFGQKSGAWEIVGETEKEGAGYEEGFDLETGKRITYKWFSGVMFEKKEEKESLNSFPAIASHVTANARRLLFNYILQAGFENVYYCDTDSLFVNETGLNRLKTCLSDVHLGFLKLEEIKKNLCLYGAKDYVWESGEKHKGVPKDATKIEEGIWEYWEWSKLGRLTKENSIDQYFNKKIVKRLKRQYVKGWILATGKVVPLEFDYVAGKNIILPFEETRYFKNGDILKYPEQKMWVAKEFKQ